MAREKNGWRKKAKKIRIFIGESNILSFGLFPVTGNFEFEI